MACFQCARDEKPGIQNFLSASANMPCLKILEKMWPDPISNCPLSVTGSVLIPRGRSLILEISGNPYIKSEIRKP